MSLLATASTWDTKDIQCNKKRKKCTFQESVQKQEESKNRINDLLNNMKNVIPDNEGVNLGNFEPLHPPEMPATDKTKATPFTNPYDSNIQKSNENNSKNLSSFVPIDLTSKEGFSNRTSLASSYNDSYGGNLSEYMKPFMNKMGSPLMETKQILGNEKLIEKLNYIIHLLEEQKHEPTQHITEEFLLYTFLGVFIIYIVDSFSRAGKYIR